jgi:putative hydrolase of the HAD superfamily
MKYKAVIFDLFGTLVQNYPRHDSENVLRHMASVLSVSPDGLIRLWHDTFDQRMNGTFQNYQECLRYICGELGVSPEDSQIDLAAQMRFEMTKQEIMTPREDAIEVLSNLKSRGYRTGLISNASIETSTLWNDTPLSPFIDAAIFSGPLGIMKPDRRIYLIVAEQFAVEPNHCMYVADGIGGELEGASQIGMYSVLIETTSEDTYEMRREIWHGSKISSLREILTLIK